MVTTTIGAPPWTGRRRSLGERILGALSRPPEDPAVAAAEDLTVADALTDLLRLFPDLRERVAGRRVLDFGCGSGRQAVAFAAAGAAYVLGVDTNPGALAHARELARREGGPVEFASRIPETAQGTFDVVLSKDSMEHFADPAAELARMAAALRPGGALLVTFGPPWFAPAGSHMPYQASATRSTPLSFSVGASGRNGERVSLPTARIRTLPARCCGMASVNVEIANGIWPPTRSLMIGALPR